MIIQIKNELDCAIEFHWEYNTIKGAVMLYGAKINPNTNSVIYGNFVSFFEGPYIRPSTLRIASWKRKKTYLKWEMKKYIATGSFKDCTGKLVEHEIIHNSKDNVTLRFYYNLSINLPNYQNIQ
ncbi:MAG: hypothetical protein IT243_07360 [Bacteroidia bacterium]|nr:hypothetical protein [Bacteroidia bacterium]